MRCTSTPRCLAHSNDGTLLPCRGMARTTTNCPFVWVPAADQFVCFAPPLTCACKRVHERNAAVLCTTLCLAHCV